MIEREVSNWNPYMIYVWTRPMLQRWYDTVGSFGLYQGRMWTPKAKRLAVGRYEVRFVEYVP